MNVFMQLIQGVLHRLVLLCSLMMCSWAFAAATQSATAPNEAVNSATGIGETGSSTASSTPNGSTAKPATAKTPANGLTNTPAHLQSELQKQAIRLSQLESANRDALTRNQALQLENDNLAVQVKVLQGERSAQMFLYGAATIVVGAILGFIWASFMQRRQRRWS